MGFEGGEPANPQRRSFDILKVDHSCFALICGWDARDPVEVMKALDLFKDLFRHMEWADAAVWRAVLSSPAALSDERIKTLLHHIHMVQHAFIDVWREQSHSANRGSDLALTELPEWGGQFHQLAVTHLQSLTEEDLDRPLVMPWAKYLTKHLGRDPDVTTKGETVLQVAAHSTYHRGQVNARLRELGSEPPLVDYIAWIWFGKPAADWGEATLGIAGVAPVMDGKR